MKEMKTKTELLPKEKKGARKRKAFVPDESDVISSESKKRLKTQTESTLSIVSNKDKQIGVKVGLNY